MNNAQLMHELHKVHVQAEADRNFFANTVEQINVHAQRLDILRKGVRPHLTS